MAKKYRLQMKFNKEERRGFMTEKTFDDIVERDDMAGKIESFTHGYDANLNWFALKIIVEDVTGI